MLNLILLVASFGAQTAPVSLPPDSPRLHVLSKVAPVYPPIAKAAQVSGTVKLQIEITETGAVGHVKVLSGPPMLLGSAQECVSKWTYDPVVIDGKPAPVSTIVSINYDLPAPINPNDQKIASEFFAAQNSCLQAFHDHADAAVTSSQCVKAAQIAQTFSTGERFVERRSAYIYASGALLRNHQFPEALEYANKAIAVIEQGHDDDSGASAAYSTRAQADAALGNLGEASNDLDKSEALEKAAIQKMMPDEPEFTRRQYIPTLRGLLNFHAQVLEAEGKTPEAQQKVDEANKLSTGDSSMPPPSKP